MTEIKHVTLHLSSILEQVRKDFYSLISALACRLQREAASLSLPESPGGGCESPAASGECSGYPRHSHPVRKARQSLRVLLYPGRSRGDSCRPGAPVPAALLLHTAAASEEASLRAWRQRQWCTLAFGRALLLLSGFVTWISAS